MHEGVRQCAGSCAWKCSRILKTRSFHSVPELIGLFKTHVLSHIEYRTPAIHFAACSALAPLDSVLSRFLSSLSVSALDALVKFRLAPLAARRDISLLGVIFRALAGDAPLSCALSFALPSQLFSEGTATAGESQSVLSLRQTTSLDLL